MHGRSTRTAPSANEDVKVNVPFSARARWQLTLVTFFRAWIWSETAVVYFVPLVLAVIAAAVCVVKIAG
jgi:hypothetical protein